MRVVTIHVKVVARHVVLGMRLLEADSQKPRFSIGLSRECIQLSDLVYGPGCDLEGVEGRDEGGRFMIARALLSSGEYSAQGNVQIKGSGVREGGGGREGGRE
jgi:hypothetical protein